MYILCKYTVKDKGKRLFLLLILLCAIVGTLLQVSCRPSAKEEDEYADWLERESLTIVRTNGSRTGRHERSP